MHLAALAEEERGYPPSVLAQLEINKYMYLFIHIYIYIYIYTCIYISKYTYMHLAALAEE